MLEEQVDEKYYLSDKMCKYIRASNEKWSGNNEKSLINKSIASALNTGEGQRRCDASNYVSSDVGENYDIKIEQVGQLDIKGQDNIKRVYSAEGISQCLTDQKHNSQRLYDGLRIRKLTPKECWRLMRIP